MDEPIQPIQYVILGSAFVSLAIGLALYIWQVRVESTYFARTNVVSWLLVAMFPVLLIFTFFPQTTASGTIFGFSMTGAIAALFIVWRYGTKASKEASAEDRQLIELQDRYESQIKGLDLVIADYRSHQGIGGATLPGNETYLYKLKKKPTKRIGFKTGDIMGIKDVDVWVNSENTNMQMARFYDRSVSATIRYYGAERNNAGHVVRDIIAKELVETAGSDLPVSPTVVISTGAGMLGSSNKVKKIFHVATVHGVPNVGYQPVENIGNCVRHALEKADELDDKALKSILFPLFGTGTGGGDLPKIAETLMVSAVSYLESIPNTAIDDVYFLTRTQNQLDTCQQILEDSGKVLVDKK